MTQRSVDIKLLERQYRVNCPSDQEPALMRAAAQLNAKLVEISQATKLNNPEQIAVMAALNLCHEHDQAQAQAQQTIRDLEEKITLLQATIDEVMSAQRPGR